MISERYKRQVGLIGEANQKKLDLSTAVIIGAGGLGNIVAKYMASTGVGKIVIYDYDVIEESNLNRQLCFNMDSVGKNKAASLVKTLLKINPDIVTIAKTDKVDSDNSSNLKFSDVILDCTDNMETAYVLEDIAIKEDIPLVFAKTSNYSGVVKIIKKYPYLKRNYPTAQLNKEHSVWPAIGGIIGSMQANLALKLLIGLKVDTSLMYYDALNNEFKKILE